MKRDTRSTRLLACAFALCAALPVPAAAAREALGVFGGWGAFRDDGARPRCFAIAEPLRRGGDGGRAFLSIGWWPRAGVRGQVHVRLSRRKARGTPVMMALGQRRFALVAGGSHAWAPDARVDRAIVAAIRQATSVSIEATARTGRAFVDAYPLRGAPTAIDAAALGCGRGRV